MLKQPRCFYKSSPGGQKITFPEVPDPVKAEAGIETEIKPKIRFQVPSRLLLAIGVGSLTLLLSLSLVPQYLHKHPLSLALNGQGTPALLEQKGGNGIQSGLHFDAKLADGRIDIVAGFLTRYNSPLKPADKYAKILVETADRYSLDYRLLPAIMMQESNLCKTSDPAIHNCLGFGIHKAGTLAFDSYEDSFDRAARELKERYIDIGLVTPEQIMTKYTPSSNGSWARSVNQWIAEMEYNSRQKGLDSTEDMNLTVYSSKN